MSAGFFTLLDDIAMLADDVAVASKQATAKTMGILGDDIAVGAKKATGFRESRELQVVYKIAKGSMLNKIIILPLAFLLNFIYPPIITFILLLGGLYLAYEGAEGILHWFEKKKNKENNENEPQKSEIELMNEENKKVKAAIKTDFILSIEIIILAMSSVSDTTFTTQLSATIFVALVATIGVYGLVAGIVRLDDLGFYLKDKGLNKLGDFFISLLPIIIRFLSIIGVIAMLMVAGGIFVHNIHFLHLEIFSSIGFIYEIILGSIIGAGIVLCHKVYDKIKDN